MYWMTYSIKIRRCVRYIGRGAENEPRLYQPRDQHEDREYTSEELEVIANKLSRYVTRYGHKPFEVKENAVSYLDGRPIKSPELMVLTGELGGAIYSSACAAKAITDKTGVSVDEDDLIWIKHDNSGDGPDICVIANPSVLYSMFARVNYNDDLVIAQGMVNKKLGELRSIVVLLRKDLPLYAEALCAFEARMRRHVDRVMLTYNNCFNSKNQLMTLTSVNQLTTLHAQALSIWAPSQDTIAYIGMNSIKELQRELSNKVERVDVDKISQSQDAGSKPAEQSDESQASNDPADKPEEDLSDRQPVRVDTVLKETVLIPESCLNITRALSNLRLCLNSKAFVEVMQYSPHTMTDFIRQAIAAKTHLVLFDCAVQRLSRFIEEDLNGRKFSNPDDFAAARGGSVFLEAFNSKQYDKCKSLLSIPVIPEIANRELRQVKPVMTTTQTWLVQALCNPVNNDLDRTDLLVDVFGEEILASDKLWQSVISHPAGVTILSNYAERQLHQFSNDKRNPASNAGKQRIFAFVAEGCRTALAQAQPEAFKTLYNTLELDDLVKLLRQSSSHQSFSGWTPMHFAAHFGWHEVLSQLIDMIGPAQARELNDIRTPNRHGSQPVFSTGLTPLQLVTDRTPNAEQIRVLLTPDTDTQPAPPPQRLQFSGVSFRS